MTDRLVAGVDCSTQSTKVLVVDVETGEVVATGRHRHRVTGTDGARETDPDQWWQALASALAQTGCAGQIGGISIAGQQHGLVVLGDHGRPLRPAMLWSDTRSAEQAIALRGALGGADVWADRIGVVPVASFTVSKWAWLRETEPQVVDAVRAVRLPHDHLTERLAGHAVTDRGDASGTGWWSTESGDYVAEVLELDGVRLDRDLLPEVAGPTAVVGEVSRRMAGELGLAPARLPASPTQPAGSCPWRRP